MDLVPVTCREIIVSYAALIVKLAGGEELSADEKEVIEFLISQREDAGERAV